MLEMTPCAPGADAPSSTPEQAGNDPRQKIDFSDHPEGAAAGSLLSLSRDTRYIDLARMRLAVLHKKYWLAIRNSEKLVDFRLGSCPIYLEAGDPILFALGVRHRRNEPTQLPAQRLPSSARRLTSALHQPWKTAMEPPSQLLPAATTSQEPESESPMRCWSILLPSLVQNKNNSSWDS